MKYFEVELELITGFMCGVEWIPKGAIEDDFGHWMVDLGILRLVITYN